MRLGCARRAFFVLMMSAAVSAASAQTRDEIRQQNEQLYQQYQQGNDQAGTAPPIAGQGGSDNSAYASSPPPADEAGRAGGGGNLLAQLLDRVNRLEGQNRQLSGRVDELQRDLQTQTAALNKQIGDLSFAVQQGHGAGAASPAPVGAPAYAPGPAAAPVPARPAGRPARTIAAAPTPAPPPPGPRGAGAAYRLASGYSAAGNYREAALTYYDVYNRQPRGPLAADALLHVGSSMIALGQNGAACEALGKVRAEFPNARGNVARSEAALRTRAHC